MIGGVENTMSIVPETEFGKVLFDHERMINDHDKQIAGLVQKVDGFDVKFEEIKTLVINGNRESMELFRSVISHEQNMDKVRQEFKQKTAEIELSMKAKQLEMTEKQNELVENQKSEKEKWEREQKAENRKIIRDTIGKMVVWGGPAVIAIVTGISQLIEAYFK